MPTAAAEKARASMRESVEKNRPQVAMAEETLRLLRDGERLEKELAVLGPPDKKGKAMDSQRIINVLAGIVLTFLGWWSNNIWQTVQGMQGQVTQLNVELARNYAPRLEMQGNFDRIYSKLDAIEKNTKGAR